MASGFCQWLNRARVKGPVFSLHQDHISCASSMAQVAPGRYCSFLHVIQRCNHHFGCGSLGPLPPPLLTILMLLLLLLQASRRRNSISSSCVCCCCMDVMHIINNHHDRSPPPPPPLLKLASTPPCATLFHTDQTAAPI